MRAVFAELHGSDAGRLRAGNIKMTQPTAFTTAMLAWGLLQFPKGFGGSKTGVLQQIQVRCISLSQKRSHRHTLLQCTAVTSPVLPASGTPAHSGTPCQSASVLWRRR